MFLSHRADWALRLQKEFVSKLIPVVEKKKLVPLSCRNDIMCPGSWLVTTQRPSAGPFYVALPSVEQCYTKFFLCLGFLLLPTNQRLSMFSPLCWKRSSGLQEVCHIISFSTLCNHRSAISCKHLNRQFRRKEWIISVRPSNKFSYY